MKNRINVTGLDFIFYKCLEALYGDCPLSTLKGTTQFKIEFKEPPEYLAEEAECPYCGKIAKAQLSNTVSTQIRTSDFAQRVFRSTESRKSYTKEFQEESIKESTKYLEGQKGISQYAKYDIDYKYFNDQGVMRKVKSSEVRGREDRANEIAKSVEHLVDTDSKVLGRRSDG